MTKKQIYLSIFVLYLIFSLGYIIYIQWNSFKLRYIQQSFNQGRQTTIQELIAQAENSECQPFPVYIDEKRVQLVNLACLQGGAEQNQEE